MTESANFLSTNFLPTFIDAYRKHTCLWLVKSPDYSKRHCKTAAYKDLIQLSKKTAPSCDLSFIKRKIEILRGSFRREHRKVRASMKTANVNDPVYKPKLWYYDLLLFLQDQDDPVQSTAAPEDQEQDVDQDLQDFVTYTEEEDNTTFEVDPEYAKATPTYRHLKRPRFENEGSSQQDLFQAPAHAQEDEFDKFGQVVAAKLRRMTPIQEIYAENLINQVLFSGVMDRLQDNSTIVLHEPQLYNV